MLSWLSVREVINEQRSWGCGVKEGGSGNPKEEVTSSCFQACGMLGSLAESPVPKGGVGEEGQADWNGGQFCLRLGARL